jgi:hypothetical protein
MSYSRNNAKNNNNNKQSIVMHCKVCESARKSPAVVASHFPKNRNGITICPTLLEQECRQCGRRGHTVKYCTYVQDDLWVAKQEEEYAANEKRQNKLNKQAAVKFSREMAKSFDMLFESSDDEEEEEEAEAKKQLAKQQAKEAKKAKELQQVKQHIVKLNWATAESDSSGDEEEE